MSENCQAVLTLWRKVSDVWKPDQSRDQDAVVVMVVDVVVVVVELESASVSMPYKNGKLRPFVTENTRHSR